MKVEIWEVLPITTWKKPLINISTWWRSCRACNTSYICNTNGSGRCPTCRLEVRCAAQG